ncbi:hypothetical protein KCU92_g291, partial [Aureobasidium melanogenum]
MSWSLNQELSACGKNLLRYGVIEQRSGRELVTSSERDPPFELAPICESTQAMHSHRGGYTICLASFRTLLEMDHWNSIRLLGHCAQCRAMIMQTGIQAKGTLRSVCPDHISYQNVGDLRRSFRCGVLLIGDLFAAWPDHVVDLTFGSGLLPLAYRIPIPRVRKWQRAWEDPSPNKYLGELFKICAQNQDGTALTKHSVAERTKGSTSFFPHLANSAIKHVYGLTDVTRATVEESLLIGEEVIGKDCKQVVKPSALPIKGMVTAEVYLQHVTLLLEDTLVGLPTSLLGRRVDLLESGKCGEYLAHIAPMKTRDLGDSLVQARLMEAPTVLPKINY